VVTGANGFVGRELLHQITEAGHSAVGLVRLSRLREERGYWMDVPNRPEIADVETLSSFLSEASSPRTIVHSVASNFRPATESSDGDLARENVSLFASVVRAAVASPCVAGVVITSSMAAVRGPNQMFTPPNRYYTSKDWNTVSELSENEFGGSYQWSKKESERIAMELAAKSGLPLISLCPR
jgi:nucleoside-diphosphate-sugar epimerase